MIKKMICLSFLTAIILYCGKANAINPQQLDCLAKTVYFEAGNQSVIGKKAVAYVTLNRVFTNGFPSSVCEVIYQKGQYGWTTLNKKVHKGYLWNLSKHIASIVYKEYNTTKDPTNGSTYYCRISEHFPWLKRIKSKKRIGGHIFYRI